jgi:single-strand DNA-binding protein
MNNISISGRLVRDVDLTETINGVPNARFSVAVQDGKDKVDYFVCVAWDKEAKSIAKYFKKGSPIELYGSMNSFVTDTRTNWALTVRGWNFVLTKKEEAEEETPF